MGAKARCGALSGPSFAAEVARGLPCALTLASQDAAFARETAALLHGGRMRIYYSTDLVGVEIGGAVKNVMAIAAGISDGLGLGLNARAALITRGLAEMARLGAALGGSAETLFGLAGAGDLILTATGELSRNRRVGLELAQGRPLKDILAHLGHVAEGVRSAKEVARLAKAKGVDMPVSDAVNAVLDGKLTPAKAVELLLSRDPKQRALQAPDAADAVIQGHEPRQVGLVVAAGLERRKQSDRAAPTVERDREDRRARGVGDVIEAAAPGRCRACGFPPGAMPRNTARSRSIIVTACATAPCGASRTTGVPPNQRISQPSGG